MSHEDPNHPFQQPQNWNMNYYQTYENQLPQIRQQENERLFGHFQDNSEFSSPAKKRRISPERPSAQLLPSMNNYGTNKFDSQENIFPLENGRIPPCNYLPPLNNTLLREPIPKFGADCMEPNPTFNTDIFPMCFPTVAQTTPSFSGNFSPFDNGFKNHQSSTKTQNYQVQTNLINHSANTHFNFGSCPQPHHLLKRKFDDFSAPNSIHNDGRNELSYGSYPEQSFLNCNKNDCMGLPTSPSSGMGIFRMKSSGGMESTQKEPASQSPIGLPNFLQVDGLGTQKLYRRGTAPVAQTSLNKVRKDIPNPDAMMSKISAQLEPIQVTESNMGNATNQQHSVLLQKPETNQNEVIQTAIASIPTGDQDVDAFEEDEDEEPQFKVRELANHFGFSKDAKKHWRFRDLKRALLEKILPEHQRFIENHPQHSLILHRLPQKMSRGQFCKRIMLLVFNFIVRDGKHPKFWTSKTQDQRDNMEQHSKQCFLDQQITEEEYFFYTLQFAEEISKLKDDQPELPIPDCFVRAQENFLERLSASATANGTNGAPSASAANG